jgi:hypothetical protein
MTVCDSSTVIRAVSTTKRMDGLAKRSQAIVVAGLFLPLVGTGCAVPKRVLKPAQDPSLLDDLSYVHYLAHTPVVTVDEGMRAVLMLAGPTERWPTFEDRRAELSRLGAVKDAWRLESDQILTKGTLAYMLRVTCKMPRSLNERLAARTGLGARRYALRTCVDRGLLSYGRTSDPVIGGELVTALTRAQEQRSSTGPEAP